MPLRDDLLNPIPGENPCGENLRYSAIYDKIKEARREEDDAPQGEWRRERKVADYPLVIKLAGEALATKSKDLQIAAWLTEALIKTESFRGLRAGLDLIRGLIENFWEGLYPEIEDGDLELRAAPLEWLGTRMDSILKTLPITRTGASWYQYREARSVGYEEDADDAAKQEAREAAIAEGRMTGEEWDQAFNATPKEFYVELEATIDGSLETLEALSELCSNKFGDYSPSFAPMQATLEEIRHTVHNLLQKKQESEPDEDSVEIEVGAEETATEEEEMMVEAETQAARTARARAARGTVSAEPADREDAFRRVAAAAAFLRREDPYSATPYLLLRSLRFGEFRSAGS
ncbi:MAG: type VI secretion system protein TssA, partial [candidate division WOR-3 bacterium]